MVMLRFQALVFTLLGLLSCCLALVKSSKDIIPRYHIAFGDSYTESGFNLNGQYPNPSNHFGNPTVGRGTATGGWNWLHYLSLRYNVSNTYSFNFAYGGATTDERIVTPESSADASATYQVYNDFKDHLSKGPWQANNTIFSLLIGINDINRCITAGLSMRRTLPKLMKQRKSIVNSLYKAGARQFLFQNIPPLDRTPRTQYLRTVTQNQLWVAGYNKAIAQFNNETRMAYPDAVIYEYDLWSFFTGVLDNPTTYNFTSNTTVGTGDYPNIWWNTYHPGYAFHNLWAQDLAFQLGYNGSF